MGAKYTKRRLGRQLASQSAAHAAMATAARASGGAPAIRWEAGPPPAPRGRRPSDRAPVAIWPTRSGRPRHSTRLLVSSSGARRSWQRGAAPAGDSLYPTRSLDPGGQRAPDAHDGHPTLGSGRQTAPARQGDGSRGTARPRCRAGAPGHLGPPRRLATGGVCGTDVTQRPISGRESAAVRPHNAGCETDPVW